MRDHGGNLQAAQERFGSGGAPWIDLSTGINALPYPVGTVPPEAWTRLPEPGALRCLEAAARQCYGTALDVVAMAGAQAAIQLVPMLAPPGQAAILAPTYNEHAAALRAQGWQVREVGQTEALHGADLAVVVNPNNPDGRRHAPDSLLRLAGKVGLLIVDESFADPEPELAVSSCRLPVPANLIVLRSFGKFYGLAGLRLGFALSSAELAARMRERIGPWPVSGMAIAIAERALQDTAWSRRTAARLMRDAARLDALAQEGGWIRIGGTPLFRTYATPDAADAQSVLARHHIWTRVFPYSGSWLRLGLPGPEPDWVRLQAALRETTRRM